MKRFFASVLVTLALTVQASATDFSHWAVLVVSGDNRAHSGNPSAVFDNARHDLVRAFTAIGFSPANVAQFSVTPDPAAQPVAIGAIANTLWDLSSRAPDGCLIYFTSHGTPDGIIVGDALLPPSKLAAMVTNACGDKPSVVVMSSCFSGQFVPDVVGDSRMVLTAARPDRTSFGCGEEDHYTFFDDCFLRAMAKSSGFPQLGSLVQDCVAVREQQMNATPPSEPQLSIGPKVASGLKWR